MNELLFQTLVLVAITFVPTLELRFSIPVGILAGSVVVPWFGSLGGFGLPWAYVFLVCVLANILLGFLWFWALDLVVQRFLLPSWPWFKRWYERRVAKAQRRAQPHIKRWGWLGLALFIAIPIPGSGVYTGGLAAYALGFKRREYAIAMLLGVFTAGLAVLLLTLGVDAFFSWL